MTPKHCLSAGQNLGGTVQLTMSFLHAHQIGSASMHPTLTACAQPRLIFGGSRSGRGSSRECNSGIPLLAHQRAYNRRSSCVVRAEADQDEELPWERRERLQKAAETKDLGLPFGVYLIASVLVAIAAVGSVFEIINKNPLFGIVQPSSPVWLPILGFFAVTGVPSAGFLLFKAINAANEQAERQNKMDGY